MPTGKRIRKPKVKTIIISKRGRINEGAPTLYRPEYAEQCVKDMAEGFTLTAFAGSIGVSRECVYDWIDKYPEFSHAFKQGKAARQRRFEKELFTDSNPAKIIFGLKNCAPDDFKDKQEFGVTDTAGNDAQLIVSLGAQIAQSMRKP